MAHGFLLWRGILGHFRLQVGCALAYGHLNENFS